ncbi:MAG: glycosyltransferase family 2 protein [Sedimentitalea sp.]
MTGLASIILPAHNEAGYIDTCLSALLESEPPQNAWSVEIIVVANGCNDDTAQRAQTFAATAKARGWSLQVLDLAEGGKLNALNKGDEQAAGGLRIYLDADVTVTPPLIAQIIGALDTGAPRYASGQPTVAPARSLITRAYGRFWTTLPFLTHGVPGFGIFAVNAAGRARWSTFPDIISDDTFVRLHFAPAERIGVPASYSWPMVEGFTNLVRVRRRQNDGVDEIAAKAPRLLRNDEKHVLGMGGVLARLVRDPVGFVTYAAVSLAVKSNYARNQTRWARGR